MSLNEHSPSQKKNSKNNENFNNFESSGIQIIEETVSKTFNEKPGRLMHYKEKGKNKIKKDIHKKLNSSNEIEIVQEQKIVKIKHLINNEFIDTYDPMIQDNKAHPKLKFFIDNESVSESDKDLSSASLSSEEQENNDEEIKK